MSNNLKIILALNAHPKIGSQTIKKALTAFNDNAEELWKSDNGKITSRLDKKISSLILEARSKFDPDQESENLKRLDIGYVSIFDKEYPEILKEIPDSPAILYLRGNCDLFGTLALAVVGSRKYTPYGKRVAYKLSKECAEAGLTIVSGLALGIDAEAHRAALEAKGKTIAVMACGLDRIYPQANHDLANKILANEGLIISENPPQTPPLKQHFPARNRIIAGISLGTLVVEAAEKSGALITAIEALEYNREVFAVPGNIDSESSKGANLLIQSGAKLVLSIQDILGELNIEVKSSQSKVRELIPESPEEKEIFDIIGDSELIVDIICRKSNLNIVQIGSVLTIMEMKGILENTGGRWRRRS